MPRSEVPAVFITWTTSRSGCGTWLSRVEERGG
jgi:hypothetical protein